MQLNLISCGKADGRPHSGHNFELRKKDKSAYKLKIKENQKLETQSYTNELHEALLKKHCSTFWKTWNSKFNNRSTSHQIDGCVDEKTITLKFAKHFAKISSKNSNRTTELLAELLYAQHMLVLR